MDKEFPYCSIAEFTGETNHCYTHILVNKTPQCALRYLKGINILSVTLSNKTLLPCQGFFHGYKNNVIFIPDLIVAKHTILK